MYDIDSDLKTIKAYTIEAQQQDTIIELTTINGKLLILKSTVHGVSKQTM